MSVALYRKLNARNIVLEEGGSSAQSIGVRRKDGTYAFKAWGGFVDRPLARALVDAQPVQLQITRVGVGQQWALSWTELEPGQHVLGCLFGERAYSVLEDGHPIVIDPPPAR